MNPSVKERLKELIAKEGVAILQTPERVRGWLAYSCPEAGREQEMLTAALEEGVPQALLQYYDTADLQDSLTARREFASEEASWAVEAWRDALASAQESFDLFCAEEETSPAPPAKDRTTSPPASVAKQTESWIQAPETWVLIGAMLACFGLILSLGALAAWRMVGVVLAALGAGSVVAGWTEASSVEHRS